MTTQPIISKRQFNELWFEGRLGNRGGIWNSVEDFEGSGFRGTAAISYNGRNGGGPFIKGIPAPNVRQEIDKLEQLGWRRQSLRILEQFNKGEYIYRMNGELTRTEEGLALYYSLDNALMRDALRQSGRQVFRLTADYVLRHHLDPQDYEDLMELHELYPDHAIEFSVLDKCVGFLPHRRMIVWEVRYY